MSDRTRDEELRSGELADRADTAAALDNPAFTEAAAGTAMPGNPVPDDPEADDLAPERQADA
ncbi:hypothetical protein [Homoserinibacter sp. YIM 151385]|uniref:hypothetical protein n=1 Tax=Homoserinibacter sp. YIM 151385 TaxID=2985506 RepID=UPI0022F0080A|nr:hypothetical protein [Homoserinibacter sp. YIM 151385]WBU38364.1 hypothetical protein OF852_01915 [Homoserinibacter sp. YIM 151385]